MSQTVLTTHDDVRLLLGEDDPSNYAVESERVKLMIARRAQQIGARIGMGNAWVTSAFTLTAGSLADYTLPGSLTYARVIALRIAATGQSMERMDFDLINRMREGLKSGDSASGDPRYYALWEDAAQLVNVRIERIPSEARAIDVLRAVLPTGVYTDATAIPFSDLALAALEQDVALECWALMTDEQRAERHLGKEVAQLWADTSKRAILDEIARLNRLKTSVRGVGVL